MQAQPVLAGQSSNGALTASQAACLPLAARGVPRSWI